MTSTQVYRILLILILCTTGFSQEEKTVFKNNYDISPYFGFGFKPTYVRDQFGVIFDLHVGGALGKKVRLGFKFNSLANAVTVTSDSLRNLRMSYYGLEGVYVFNPEKAVHASIATFIGTGGLVYHNPKYNYYFYPDAYFYWRRDIDAIFVLEPAANMEINLTKYLGLELGVSYRFVTGTTLKGITNEDARGAAINIAFDIRAF